MESQNLLAARFREVFLNGKWIANTNYKVLLSDVTWHEASQKTGSLNTIAGLVYHIDYYIAGITDVLEGGPLEIRDKYSFDVPQIESKEDWEKLLDKFYRDAEKFADRIEHIPDEKLDETFVDSQYGSYRRNIEGVIEHGYYHLGQISLIKKMIRER